MASTRAFVPEIELLQRERDLDAPAWLWTRPPRRARSARSRSWRLAWGVGRLSRRHRRRHFGEESPLAAQEQGCPGGADRPGRRTGASARDAGEVVLAHHPLVTALPFFVPAFIVVGLIAAIVWRDRHAPEGAEGEDGS